MSQRRHVSAMGETSPTASRPATALPAHMVAVVARTRYGRRKNHAHAARKPAIPRMLLAGLGGRRAVPLHPVRPPGGNALALRFLIMEGNTRTARNRYA